MARYYEIEDVRRSVNRKMWVVITVLSVMSLFSLLSAIIAYARPLAVVAFDTDGKPMLFKDTISPRQTMTDIRVKYFAKKYTETLMGINSASLDKDLAQALNWMTPEQRYLYMNDEQYEEELERRREFREKKVQLRTSFPKMEVRIGKYKPEQLDGRIYVLVIGQMIFEPIMGKWTEQEEIRKYFMAKIVLQRVPVTEISIFGLLVHYVEQHIFEDQQEYEQYLVKQAAS